MIPIDGSGGVEQRYVEDCPVCCRANVVHVRIEGDDDVSVWAEAE